MEREKESQEKVVKDFCSRGAPISTSSRDLVVSTLSSCLGKDASVGMVNSCSGSRKWGKRRDLVNYWRDLTV